MIFDCSKLYQYLINLRRECTINWLSADMFRGKLDPQLSHFTTIDQNFNHMWRVFITFHPPWYLHYCLHVNMRKINYPNYQRWKIPNAGSILCWNRKRDNANSSAIQLRASTIDVFLRTDISVRCRGFCRHLSMHVCILLTNKILMERNTNSCALSHRNVLESKYNVA